MRIMVGCPVLHREWILPAWFDHVEAAFKRLEERYPTPVPFVLMEYADRLVGESIEPRWSHDYLFLGDTIRDETFGVAMEECAKRGIKVCLEHADDARPLDLRQWDDKRYRRMVELRNQLLGVVRREAPDLFLSLDSDILLHPDALADMIEQIEEGQRLPALGKIAVGGKVYLSQYGVQCPSWANLGREGSITRSDTSGTFRVDVIMAVKLMTPAAYEVDYRFDLQGEDIGWSKAAREAGVRFVWTGRSASKHIFSRFLCGVDGHGLYLGQCPQDPGHDDPVSALEVVDPRVGW